MKSLFLVHTEYHLLLSLQIIRKFHSNISDENTIICLKTKERFIDTKFIKIDNIIIQGIDDPLNYFTINEILKSSYLNFYYFHNFNIIIRWLSWQLKTLGTNIFLVQDGMAAYAYFKTILKPAIILRDTFKDYIKLLRGGLTINRLFLSNSFKYGNNYAIDKIFLTNPEMFDRKTRKNNKEIVKIPPFDEKSSRLLRAIFLDYEMGSRQNIILLINQPLWNEKLIDREIEFLTTVCECLPTRQLYIKLHPNTSNLHKEKYRQLIDAKILATNLPAEVIIQEIVDSTIIAINSTALLQNNSSNRFYFFEPVFYDLNDRAFNVLKIRVFNHIKVVKNAQDII